MPNSTKDVTKSKTGSLPSSPSIVVQGPLCHTLPPSSQTYPLMPELHGRWGPLQRQPPRPSPIAAVLSLQDSLRKVTALWKSDFGSRLLRHELSVLLFQKHFWGRSYWSACTCWILLDLKQRNELNCALGLRVSQSPPHDRCWTRRQHSQRSVSLTEGLR